MVADPATRARDHLANERTYLAWLRTAAAVMALGLAVAGFADGRQFTSAVAGALLVAVGSAGVGYGTLRYRQVFRDLEANVYIAAGHGRAPVVASVVLVVAVVGALALVVAGR